MLISFGARTSSLNAIPDLAIPGLSTNGALVKVDLGETPTNYAANFEAIIAAVKIHALEKPALVSFTMELQREYQILERREFGKNAAAYVPTPVATPSTPNGVTELKATPEEMPTLAANVLHAETVENLSVKTANFSPKAV